MDGAQFDRWSRRLGSRLSRRVTLAGLAAGVVGAVAVEPVAAKKCKGNKKTCKGKCVNLKKDSKHCGACNNACAATERCQAGACEERACGQGGKCFAFVASGSSNGNIGGLLVADARCTTLANSAGLPGTYMAWLSDATGSPSTRFVKSTGPYVMPNGLVVADSWNALTSGADLTLPIDKNELNQAYDTFVWTNTTVTGQVVAPAFSCQNWRSSSAAESVAVLGRTRFSDSRWTAFAQNTTCDTVYSYYCFQQS